MKTMKKKKPVFISYIHEPQTQDIVFPEHIKDVDLFKSSHLFCQHPWLRDEMILIQIQYQNIKPNTIISSITSYHFNTAGQKALTLWHLKVVNQHHMSLGSAASLLLTLCSRAFIMFLPLLHTIKMCCSDTCISLKLHRDATNTLSYCHEHQPFFPH